MIMTIASILALIGVVLIAINKTTTGQFMWLISNPIIVYYNFTKQEYAMMGLFVAYTIINMFGIINSLKNKNTKNVK